MTAARRLVEHAHLEPFHKGQVYGRADHDELREGHFELDVFQTVNFYSLTG